MVAPVSVRVEGSRFAIFKDDLKLVSPKRVIGKDEIEVISLVNFTVFLGRRYESRDLDVVFRERDFVKDSFKEKENRQICGKTISGLISVRESERCIVVIAFSAKTKRT